ncbi:hypothetical protein PV325_010934 [Microctonus aethiopoides]|nr:hypothetical protein PV325_010934 [Microctonus aethiopoides]
MNVQECCTNRKPIQELTTGQVMAHRPQDDRHEDSDDEEFQEFYDFPEENDFADYQDVGSDDEFDDDDQENYEHNDYDDPLYEGASLSVGESLSTILTFSLKYKLTLACLSDMLKLILLFIPKPNLFKSTLHLFRKSFSRIDTPVVRHFYCSSCFAHLGENENCDACSQVTQANSYFLIAPIIERLKTLYRRPGFINKPQHRNQRRKTNIENFEDIYDG